MLLFRGMSAFLIVHFQLYLLLFSGTLRLHLLLSRCAKSWRHSRS